MKLEEMLARIKMLADQENLTSEEVKELEDLNAKVASMTAKAAAKVNSEAATKMLEEERKAETQKQIDAAVAKAQEKWAAQQNRLPFREGAPYAAKFAGTWKYDGIKPEDLSLAIDLCKQMRIEVNPNAYKAMALKLRDLPKNEIGQYVKDAFKMETGIEVTNEAVDAAVKTEGDPNYSTGSTVGSDWVGTAYSSSIWEAIRTGALVLQGIPEIVVPDGYSNMYVPLESTDPTWYKVAEASAGDATLKVPSGTVSSSQLATANKQITIGKLGARAVFTGEMNEDSLINFAPQLRKQLELSGADILEHVAIDGDVETSASKNINTIAGTPTSTKPYLLFDGFRKLALVTNTANSRSAAGALVVEDFLDTLKLMGTAGLAGADPRMCEFVIDANVYYAMAKLPEFKTKDVSNAVSVENGFVKSAWNVPVLVSWNMHKESAKRMANTAGKVNGTDSSNTVGSIVAVRKDQWKQAFKRRMTIETTRIANADATEIVALLRWGLAYRDTEASAISYNVGV